jgi:hypothetical protein
LPRPTTGRRTIIKSLGRLLRHSERSNNKIEYHLTGVAFLCFQDVRQKTNLHGVTLRAERGGRECSVAGGARRSGCASMAGLWPAHSCRSPSRFVRHGRARSRTRHEANCISAGGNFRKATGATNLLLGRIRQGPCAAEGVKRKIPLHCGGPAVELLIRPSRME